MLQAQHLTKNYIQEKSLYLGISKRVVRIHLQSLHTSPSFRLSSPSFLVLLFVNFFLSINFFIINNNLFILYFCIIFFLCAHFWFSGMACLSYIYTWPTMLGIVTWLHAFFYKQRFFQFSLSVAWHSHKLSFKCCLGVA